MQLTGQWLGSRVVKSVQFHSKVKESFPARIGCWGAVLLKGYPLSLARTIFQEKFPVYQCVTCRMQAAACAYLRYIVIATYCEAANENSDTESTH